MTKRSPIKTYKSIPWFIACFALVAAIANLSTGIVILATYNTGGDIALGVLTLVFAIWGAAGSIVALVLTTKQIRLNESKASFIAQVSHELRTPITSIKMYSETLAMKRFSAPEQEELLFEELNAAVRRIEDLTEQILESRPISKKKHHLPVSPEAAITGIVNSFNTNPRFQHRVHFDIVLPLPAIPVDLAALQTAVSNLILNALTHGGDGPISVRLAPSDTGVIIEVEDSGKGISPEMQKKIFEPFQRGTQTTDSGIPGFGLGLSIVKNFCNEFGAKIQVHNDSKTGGAVFSLHINK
ncbi:MAG: HAMP domain-containing sensor histidine kinase [Bradymonadales bacterium]|jgi:two-component system phosphate regulon sensor histidine kinase PhoR